MGYKVLKDSDMQIPKLKMKELVNQDALSQREQKRVHTLFNFFCLNDNAIKFK